MPVTQQHSETCPQHVKVEGFMMRLEDAVVEMKEEIGLILIALRGDLKTGETGLRGAMEMIRRDIADIRAQIRSMDIRIQDLENVEKEIKNTAWDVLKGMGKWIGWLIAGAAAAALGYEKFIV